MPTISCIRLATRASLPALLVIAVVVAGPAPAAASIGEPPAAPTLLTPPPGWVFSFTAVQLFSVIASDPDNEPYTAVITVRDAQDASVKRIFATHASPSSVKASGVPVPPLPPGNYVWSAQAMDATGGLSAMSTTSSFAVASPPTAGAGVLVGTITYEGDGVSHGSCESTAFHLQAASAGVIAHGSLVGFAGHLTVTGSGGSSCENASYGAGPLTLTLVGTGPTESALRCSSVTGTYLRVAAVFTIQVQGGCTVNQFPAQNVRFTAVLAFTPTEPGGGVVRAFDEAAVAGPYTVVPS